MRNWNDDPFTQKARRENYEARSVYKLQEIHKKDGILAGAKLILDLGAAPGSWTQYCLEVAPSATVFAIDLSPLHVSDSRIRFAQQDIEGMDFLQFISPNPTVDIVLSDMAPKTTGIRSVDADRSTELALGALRISDQVLALGGHCVVKIFMSESLKSIESEFRKRFHNTRLLRPESTRKQSREIFVVGKSKMAR